MARKKVNPEMEQDKNPLEETHIPENELMDSGRAAGSEGETSEAPPAQEPDVAGESARDGETPEEPPADAATLASAPLTDPPAPAEEQPPGEEAGGSAASEDDLLPGGGTPDAVHEAGTVPQKEGDGLSGQENAQAYEVDLSDAPEPPPASSHPSAEEDDWGFQEEHREPEPPLKDPEPAPAPSKSDRQKFYELKFNELDRNLTQEERQEWNSIYASYRGRSALSGVIIGVDPLSIFVRNPKTGQMEKQTMYCAIVVPYRVRVVIPASEMWEPGQERPDFVLNNMVGASIDFIIIKVDRESKFAIGSRRLAGRAQRYFFAHREDLHRIGARVKCRTLAVGPRRCLVECYGHDIDVTQREMRYASIPDLRDEYHPGMEIDCVVKVYDPDQDKLVISIKETEANPFMGAEERHPVGARRLAVISGKYGGGVFCNLPDGVVCMCNYSYQHEDADFMVGENVMLLIQRYEDEKRQIYGKIMSKW